MLAPGGRSDPLCRWTYLELLGLVEDKDGKISGNLMGFNGVSPSTLGFDGISPSTMGFNGISPSTMGFNGVWHLMDFTINYGILMGFLLKR